MSFKMFWMLLFFVVITIIINYLDNASRVPFALDQNLENESASLLFFNVL